MPRYREIAYALLRLTVGVMFFFYGVGKFIRGLDEVATGFGERFAESPLPDILAELFGFVLPFLEVILGSLLILGLFTRTALVGAALLIIALTFGTVMEPDPGTVAYNVNYALIIFALLWLSEHNSFSIDHYRHSDNSDDPERWKGHRNRPHDTGPSRA